MEPLKKAFVIPCDRGSAAIARPESSPRSERVFHIVEGAPTTKGSGEGTSKANRQDHPYAPVPPLHEQGGMFRTMSPACRTDQ